MGFFNSTDIENAADNPFALNPGRQVVKVLKSEFDSIEIKNGDRAGEEVDVWNITLWNEENDLEQRITFWAPGDDETQNARTLTNIKKMLVALEIPTSEWSDIVDNHPEKLEGLVVTVDAKKSKKDNIYIVFVGLPVQSSGSVSGLAEFSASTSSNPSDGGFGFGGA